jgi:hypothetical protein
MTIAHILGYPRIGAHRELKRALEAYWRGESSTEALEATGGELRARHWDDQAGLDLGPVGDFAFYDQVLDMCSTLGPPRRARARRRRRGPGHQFSHGAWALGSSGGSTGRLSPPLPAR